MNFLTLLQSRSKFFYFSLLILSIISTITNLGVLFVINVAVTGRHSSLFGSHNSVAFIVLIIVSFVCTAYFQKSMTVVTNNIIFDLEISIVKKITNASFDSFEKVGKAMVFSVIGDASTLGAIPETLVIFINSTMSIICALGYIFWISPLSGLIILLFIIALLSIYMAKNKMIMKDLNIARDYRDKYFLFLNELLDGFKQIKISLKRNNNLFNDYILKNRRIAKDLNTESTQKYGFNELTGSYSWLVLLGIIIFVLPSFFGLSMSDVVMFITTILLIRGPVSSLLNIIQRFSKFKISLERFDKLDELLKVNSSSDVVQSDINFDGFSSLRFENITYNYGNENDPTFKVDIDEFQITNNEIIFITGGNGSGKTTLINLLTGLYTPTSGNFFINDRQVCWDEFRLFSNNMAVVYSDQYLFKGNFDEHDITKNNSILAFFKTFLNIESVLKVDEESLFFNTKLSKGQQKRLGLLLALMEDKPIIILDEWAAEQDQKNRNLFYTRWIQEIKSQGKTIIIVSHDDDCFINAERLIKLNYGKIVSDLKSQVH